MKSGIYKIINKTNSRFYVGSAVNLQKRRQNHFSDLRLEKHKNIFLLRDFIKCGKREENFEFVILEYCERTNLIIREQHFLDIHYDNNLMCYNLDRTAGSRLGSKASKETIAKLRRSHLGLKHKEETKMKIRENPNLAARVGPNNPMFGIGFKVNQIDKKTLLVVNTFSTMLEASSKTNINHGHICDVCNGKRKTAGGFLWSKITP